MAVIPQVSASLSLSIRGVCSFTSTKTHVFAPFPTSSFAPVRSNFVSGSGSPLFVALTHFPVLSRASHVWKAASKARMISIRSEQSSQGGSSLDVWLGRLAMVGFAVAITVEIATGKGILENLGVTSPLPTVALAVTGLVGVLTAVFIFQSASQN